MVARSTRDQLAKAVGQIDLPYDGNKPLIRVEKGKMNEAWRAAESALSKADCPVYVRGGVLVMPLWRWMDTSEKLPDGEYRQTLVASLVAMNRHQLEDMLPITQPSFKNSINVLAAGKPSIRQRS